MTRSFLLALALSCTVAASITAQTTDTSPQPQAVEAGSAAKKDSPAKPEAASSVENNGKLNWEFTPDENLPNVLILGDSISIGYTLQVRELLRGKANVFRPVNSKGTRPVNCSGSMVGLNRSKRILKKHKWDVIHFNWGLHDLKHVKVTHTHQNSNDPNDPQQSSLEDYEKNMKEIVAELKKTNARLVFGTTTPIVAGTTNPLRKPEDPGLYNAVAQKIMDENGIRVNDLYSLCLPNLKKWQKPKNCHFNKVGSRKIADQVASVITEELQRE